MKFTLRDGWEVSGKYFGIERMPDAAYRERVEQFQLARGDSVPPLPVPGSDVVVHLSASNSRPARLNAYGYRSLEVRWDGKGEPHQLTFDDFGSVTDASGHEWTSRALSSEASRGGLPSNAKLAIQTRAGLEAVPA